jgi:hypothetical protein
MSYRSSRYYLICNEGIRRPGAVALADGAAVALADGAAVALADGAAVALADGAAALCIAAARRFKA